MNAIILDGQRVAARKQQQLRQQIQTSIAQGYRPPGLAVILVGHDPASEIYVKRKSKACHAVGMLSFAHALPSDISEEELLALIKQLNTTPEVDGILVQLPLPSHIDTQKIIESISPNKDVDGFHPYNIGRLLQKKPALRPCTPYGVIQLLAEYNLPINGCHAIVIGASNIVGRPMALELLLAHATVTICHRATRNLELLVQQADLIIVAAGSQDVIKPEWLNSKQILIDIGIHRLPNGTIRGDVDFTQAEARVGWITPVPGGIGPMTVCTLLQNTYQAFKTNQAKM